MATLHPQIKTQTEIPAALLEKLSPVVMEIYAMGDFHRADMRTVARESSTSFRTIYRYFGDKQTLLFRFINLWLKDLYPFAFASLESDAPLKYRIHEVLVRHLDFYERNPNVGRIVFMTVPLSCWMQDTSYAQTEMMSKLLKAIEQGQLTGALRADIPAVAIFDALNAMFHRTFLMWEYRGRKYSLVGQADVVFKILWGGIEGAPVKSSRQSKTKLQSE